MAHVPIPLGLDAKFDQFLQTPVGNDHTGASVTVLSMLARLGLDPWREASDLAALPKSSAWQRLDTLMARFTDVPIVIADRAEVTTRLIASLPNGSLYDNTKPTGNRVSKKIDTRIYFVVAIAVLIVQIGLLIFRD
ncbi:hypothetical protein [Thalassospira mesophila]|uniref:hypothetical protein n=1 Tax=Thalassospira mesophila TaxID=1293891 RepID=UPI00118036A6|nr:hypothetical protein [Thalassospira mesophila]